MRAALGCALAWVSTGMAADWQSAVTKDPPTFPPPRPLRANYVFGWSGLTAATGEAHLTKPSPNSFQLEGTGRTVGLARALWKLDASYRSVANAQPLRPVESKQIENYRAGYKLATHLTFKGNTVRSERTEGATTKTQEFTYPDLYDLHSALLFIRGQPLKDRSVYRAVVYTSASPYLATVTVLGREKTSVRAGAYNSIKLDLKLNKIGKNFELQPHRKFRRATAWISDDSDRMLLRIEGQIFIGTVFAELRSIRYDDSRS